MWNPNNTKQAAGGEEDSWEVRAFAEDTGSNAATWPPRSYTCAFCRREFRSAQALGGHMNVHRRDRARLHGQLLPHPAPSSPSPASPAPALGGAHASFLIPASGSGVCLLYQLRNPSSPREVAAAAASPVGFVLPQPPPATLFSISPAYGHATAVARNFLMDGDSSCRIQTRVDGGERQVAELGECRAGKEEVDLELRLGHGPTPS